MLKRALTSLSLALGEHTPLNQFLGVIPWHAYCMKFHDPPAHPEKAQFATMWKPSSQPGTEFELYRLFEELPAAEASHQRPLLERIQAGAGERRWRHLSTPKNIFPTTRLSRRARRNMVECSKPTSEVGAMECTVQEVSKPNMTLPWTDLKFYRLEVTEGILLKSSLKNCILRTVYSGPLCIP